MSKLLKQFKGKYCTFYREGVDRSNYGWTGVFLEYDSDYIKIKGDDGHVRLINQRALNIIIAGNWAAELDVRIDPNFKGGKE